MQKKNKPRTKAEMKILESSILLFSRKGLGGATVRVVAKHARVTTMTMYRGFADKDDLVEEALRLVIKRHFDPSQLLMVLYEDTSKQGLDVLLLSALMRWYGSLPVPATKLLMNAYLSDNEKWRSMAEEAVRELTKVMTSFVDRELQRRPKSKVAPSVVARSLLMPVFHLKMLSPEEKAPKEEKEELAQVEAILRYSLLGLREG